MRILDVTPRRVFPPTGGALARTQQLMRHLARDHEVEQFALSWCEPRPSGISISVTEPFPGYREHVWRHPVAWLSSEAGRRSWVSAPVLAGAALRVLRPALLDRMLAWADVVLVEQPWAFEHCRRRAPAARLVLAGHNVEAEKFASWAQAAGVGATAAPWLRYIERAERSAVRRADLVAVVSASDAAGLARRYAVDAERLVEVPNGADTGHYVPVGAEARRAARRALGLPDRSTVAFVGGDMPANRAALGWVRRVAARTDRFTFLVVGSVAAPSRDGSVLACGAVEDLRAHLQAADFALCPVEHGGGTKIKLLEAFAAGLPAVTFAETLHGLDARDGEHVLVADKDEHALLAALERLVDDPPLAERIGRAGRELAVARYDWRDSAHRLDEALRALVAAPTRAPVVPA